MNSCSSDWCPELFFPTDDPCQDETEALSSCTLANPDSCFPALLFPDVTTCESPTFSVIADDVCDEEGVAEPLCQDIVACCEGVFGGELESSPCQEEAFAFLSCFRQDAGCGDFMCEAGLTDAPSGAPTDDPVEAPSDAPTDDPVEAPTSAPEPTLPPATLPDSDGGGGGGSCFSDIATVEVLGVPEPVQMQHLQVGDRIRTSVNEYEPVYAFGHFTESVAGKFYQITMTNDGMTEPLEITGEHLVYLAGKQSPVRADSIRVGDSLQGQATPMVVSTIEIVEKTGLYAPLTPSGKLLVNGVAASSYIALDPKVGDAEQVELPLVSGLAIWMPHQTFAHLYMAPCRVVCMGVAPALCQSYDSEGFLRILAPAMKLAQWTMAQKSDWIRLAFLAVTMPLVLAFAAAEKMLGSSMAPFVLFLLGFLYLRTRQEKKASSVHQKSKEAACGSWLKFVYRYRST